MHYARVPASFVSHQLLGSYAVQSDIGDYDVDEHGSGIAYIKEMQFSPNQSDELLEKITKLHVMYRSVWLVCGQLGLFMVSLACLWSVWLVYGKFGLFVVSWACLWSVGLVCGQLGLFVVSWACL